MPYYGRSITVAAPVATVWQVTRDVESWPQWSPTMDAVTVADGGSVVVGSRVRVRQPRLRPATWVVDHLDELERFCWHTDGPGYRIVADHLLEASADGAGTQVRLTVMVNGLLARPLWLLTGRMIRDYLDQEADALKRRCETTPA